MAQNADQTKVITGLVRFSYVHVFKPEAIEEGQDKKYSCAILIPKKDKATLKKIEAAIEKAKENGKSDKFGGKIPANLKTPLRDGDEERPDDEAYKGMMFLNANAKNQPGVVNAQREPIIDETEFYSGCWGHASITLYPYNVNGSKGVAAGLNNVMKTKDDTNLGGRVSAEADFADIDVDDML